MRIRRIRSAGGGASKRTVCVPFSIFGLADTCVPLILTYLVEVERKVPGDGAIETRLQVGCPPVTETMRSAPVVFTDSRHARVHGLRMRKLRLVNSTVGSVRRDNLVPQNVSRQEERENRGEGQILVLYVVLVCYFSLFSSSLFFFCTRTNKATRACSPGAQGASSARARVCDGYRKTSFIPLYNTPCFPERYGSTKYSRST